MAKELQFNFRFDLNAYNMVFEYLDNLRTAATHNMAGARSYVMDFMDMDYSEKPQAKQLADAWMKSFDLGENWEDRALAVWSRQEAAYA